MTGSAPDRLCYTARWFPVALCRLERLDTALDWTVRWVLQIASNPSPKATHGAREVPSH
jgi:hypothetical protein